jgi:hypothetical protein
MALPCISTPTTIDAEPSGKSGVANVVPFSRTVELPRRKGGSDGLDIRDRLPLGWAHLAILPYFCGIWAFGTHHAEPFGTWTIGWILLWVIFSPAALWTGLWVGGTVPATFLGTLGLLVIATPFSPEAATTILTFVAGVFLGALPRVLIALAMFIGVVAVLYHWNTVAHSWQAVFGG